MTITIWKVEALFLRGYRGESLDTSNRILRIHLKISFPRKRLQISLEV